jgi:hypothetical protein
MKRLVLIGLMGILAAAAAHAQTPKDVTLFGQKYTLEAHSLEGTYANGVTIKLANDDPGNKHTNPQFVQGETAEKDRMFVAHSSAAADDIRANFFFMLTNSGPAGNFDPKVANATEFFGGAAADINRGGRPSTVTWLSDVDTGPKKDRNIMLSTFTGDDYLRFYDLDTLTGDYVGDAVLSVVQRCINADEGDPGMPSCGFLTGAMGPNGLIRWAAARARGPRSVSWTRSRTRLSTR